VAKIRAHQIDLEETEYRRKRQIEDKKLQAAIAREEKAKETAERKLRRELERIATREQLAKEKAERQAEKEAAKQKKRQEAEERKLEAERRRMQRIQAKKIFQNAVAGQKRLVDDMEIEGPRKRQHLARSQMRNQPSITELLK
jgi:hypothetical protein